VRRQAKGFPHQTAKPLELADYTGPHKSQA